MQSQIPEWQQAHSIIKDIIRTMADFMKTGDGEDGVSRLYQTEQTIFKSIWVQCCLFVLWPPKEKKVYHEWTTSYKLHLSTDGVTWNVYEETSTAKVCSATICNDFRTAKSPIQWVTKATYKIAPLQARVGFVAIYEYRWGICGTKSLVTNLPKLLSSWRNKIAIRKRIRK